MLRATIGLLAISYAGCADTPDDADDSGDVYGSSEQESAIPGNWNPPPDVRAAGAAEYVAYEGPPAWDGGIHCGGRLLDGTRELGDYLKAHFPGSVGSYGGYDCRQNTANASETSVHGTGRALDLFIAEDGGAADNGRGDVVANWLIVHAQEIGVQYIIWDRTDWSGDHSGDKLGTYTGPVPHIDHIHMELDHAGANRETPWFRHTTHDELDEVAFQANTTSLWAAGTAGTGGLPLGMMPGTSPSITALADGGYAIAFQANTGNLWSYTTTGGARDWRLGMKHGTSPSITALTGGGFEIAFQANTSALWTVGDAGDKDWGLGMMRGSSPSIAALAHGGFEVAFQANTSSLYTVGDAGSRGWPLGMMPGTSPSIVGLPDGRFEVAFQANTTSLSTLDPSGTATDWHLGLDRASSPSIAAVAGNVQIAFQSNNHALWLVGSHAPGRFSLGMMPGTSPSLSRSVAGKVYFQANTGELWNNRTGAMHLGMIGASSPSGT